MNLKIRLDNLDPGARLARQIRSGNNVLMARGTVLTDKNIKKLQEWGVDYVRITYEPVYKIA
jgi:hypothetical protein